MERGVVFIFVNKKALAKRGGPSRQRATVRGRGCVTDFNRSHCLSYRTSNRSPSGGTLFAWYLQRVVKWTRVRLS